MAQNPAPQRRILQHSTWITSGWEWFLEFAGRSAEAVLVISVLYASVKLLPVVHMPVSIDVIIFVAQFVALDVGGLSLGKLAKQAQEAGNEAGALYASRMSKALIMVMIAGVVVVALEQLFPLPADWKLGIDTVLLIARSILAVLYGHIIHSVQVDDQMLPAQPAPSALNDLQQRIGQSLADLQTQLERRLAEVESSQTQIQQVQGALTIDTQAVIASVLSELEPRFISAMERMERETHQQVRVSVERETAQMELTSGTHGTALPGPKLVSLPQRNAPSRTLKRAQMERETAPSSSSVSAGMTDTKSTIYRLMDEDNSRLVADVVQLTGLAKTTVWRHWNRYHEEHGTHGLARIVASEMEPPEIIETA